METEVSKTPKGLMYKRESSFNYSLPQRLRENDTRALAGSGTLCHLQYLPLSWVGRLLVGKAAEPGVSGLEKGCMTHTLYRVPGC